MVWDVGRILIKAIGRGGEAETRMEQGMWVYMAAAVGAG